MYETPFALFLDHFACAAHLTKTKEILKTKRKKKIYLFIRFREVRMTPESRTRLSPRMGGQRVNYDFMPELARTESRMMMIVLVFF